MPPDKGLFLDPWILVGIGAIWTAASSGIGWLIIRLWAERNEAEKTVVDVLKQQFEDAAKRKELWDGLNRVIEAQGREIADLKRVVGDFIADIRRKYP